MKSLKEQMKQMNEKFVSIEELTAEEKASTYGGAVTFKEVAVCYGVERPKDSNGTDRA